MLPKIGRPNGAMVYTRIALLMIPYIVMGWTIGQYGPSQDDWGMLNLFFHGNYAIWDLTRPLHMTSVAAAYWLAGGQFSGMQAISFLLTGISGVLFFEVMYRIFRVMVSQSASFLAFLAALIYVLYPSHAARYWVVLLQDPVMQSLTLSAALLFIIGSERDQSWWVIAAAIVALVTVLHKETPALMFLLFPLIPIYFGRSPLSRSWRWAILCWCVVIAGYLIWRVVFPPQYSEVARGRPIHLIDPFGSVPFLFATVSNMTIGAYSLAFNSDVATMRAKGIDWLLPIALVGAGIIVALGWLVNWTSLRSEAEKPSLRRWLALILFGGAMMVAALAPFYVYFEHPIPVGGSESRHTSVATMGLCLMLAMIAILPMIVGQFTHSFGKDRDSTAQDRRLAWWRRIGILVASLVAVIFFTGAIIRQYRMGQAYVDAWQVQRTYWQRIIDLGPTFKPNSLVIMDNFPRTLDGALLASNWWGFESAFSLFYTNFPANVQVIHEREVKQAVVTDNELTITRLGEQTTYPLQNVRVLYYDSQTQAVEMEPHLPFSWGDSVIYVTTGDNPSPSSPALNPPAHDLLDPWTQPSICLTRVPVTTGDQSPIDGVVEVATFPNNQIIDRRQVQQGTPLNFTLVTRCGIWIRVYFQTPDPTGKLSTFLLVSQYGNGQEYGTANTPESVSYSTAFNKAQPAK